MKQILINAAFGQFGELPFFLETTLQDDDKIDLYVMCKNDQSEREQLNRNPTKARVFF